MDRFIGAHPSHFQDDSGWFVVHLEDLLIVGSWQLGHQGIRSLQVLREEKILKFSGCIFCFGAFRCFPLHLFQTIQFRILVGKEFYFMETFDGYEVTNKLELIANTLSGGCLSIAI